MKQTDPVCGMKIDPSKAAARETYKGQTYSFCSQHCQGAFIQNPENYISAASVQIHDHAAVSSSSPMPRGAVHKAKDEVAKDPICGMVVAKATALHSERSGRAYYFCSVNCQAHV